MIKNVVLRFKNSDQNNLNNLYKYVFFNNKVYYSKQNLNRRKLHSNI